MASLPGPLAQLRPPRRGAFRPRASAAPVLSILFCALPLHATPDDLIAVTDPIHEELRLLETSGARELRPLPLFVRPWQGRQVQQALGDAADPPSGDLALLRLWRHLERDRPAPAAGPRSTPRLLALVAEPPPQRLEASVGVEGGAVAARDTSFFAAGAGLHGRFAFSVGGWTAFAHLMAAHVPQGRRFADPLIEGEDLILFTEESYLEYASAGPVWTWSAGAGRNRFAWGPGVEGSLLLSAQAPPLSALWAVAGLPRWRLYAATLSATLRASAGEHMAAHRLEWEARPGLRVGLAEGVRYHAGGMQLPYAIGLIPYTLVQRILVQEEPDSFATLRNNLLASLDVSWRVSPGTRLFGELLIDDLHARTAANPNKLGFQAGWEGVGTWGGTRLAWGGEWTRLSRFVYTSFFGRPWESQGLPLGYGAGPDVSRVRLWGAWDFRAGWQARLAASHSAKGEGAVDRPYLPGSARVDAWPLSGQVETGRDLEATLRWWPASGVDVSLSGGGRWTSDADHVAGRSRRDAFAAAGVRLVR